MKLRLTALAAVLLLFATTSLHTTSLAATRRRLAALARVLRTRAAPASIAAAVGRSARRVPWRVSCLEEALAAEAVLAAAGHACELRIGALRAPHAPEFHAWLECEGAVVVGASALPLVVMTARA
ncbi:MAG: lasso peptide biosynthesis B2 protein [Gemmatimonadota bacterium]